MPKINPSSSSKGLSKNNNSKPMGSSDHKIKKPNKPQKQSPSMAADEGVEVIEISDSPDRKSTPLRPVFCFRDRDGIEKAEEDEECFILEFDPYDDLEKLRLSCGGGGEGEGGGDEGEEGDFCVVAEKGKVACRDYPHPRHTCAKHPFEKTPHDSHCELCYCYVCDLSAPCSKWVGSSGHCHAFNNEAWNLEKKAMRREV